MQTLFDFFAGMSRLFAITTQPLYRYPYRNSGEGLRGDILRIGKDMEFVLSKEGEDD